MATPREELEALRAKYGSAQPAESPQDELTRLREKYAAPSIADVRLDAPAPVASSTAIGDDASGMMAAMDRAQPKVGERDLGAMESFASIGSGFLQGMLDIKPDPSGSLVAQALWKYRDQPSKNVGEFLGFVAPLGAAGKATKALGKIPRIAKMASKMPNLIRIATRGATTGAIVEAGREFSRQVQGRETDWSKVGKEAAFYATIDVALHGLGGVGKRALSLIKRGKLKEADKLIEAAAKDGRIEAPESTAGFGRESYRPRPNEIVNRVEYKTTGKTVETDLLGERNVVTGPITVKMPGVTAAELDVMKGANVLKERLVTSSKSINLSLENPIRTFERMGDDVKELIYRPVKEAEHRANVASSVLRDDMRDAIGKISGKSSKRIGIYATAQQKGGKEILDQMGITEVPALSPTEMKAYEWMRGQLQLRFGELNAARKASGMPEFVGVENYFTFFNNWKSLLDDGHSVLTIAEDQIAPHLKATAFRFAKSRSGNAKGGVNLDAINVFKKYNESAFYHIEMSPTLAKTRQLIDGQFVDGFKLSESNPEAYKFLHGWINDLAGHRYDALPPAVSRAMSVLNKNIAYSVLSFNLRSAAIQPTAMIVSLGELGPKWAMSGAAAMADPAKRAFALKNSNVLLGRQFDATVVDALEGLTGRFAGAKRKVADIGMQPLKILDQITAQGTWYGAYQRATKKLKLSHREAVNYADDIVTKTQASAARSDLAPIQREIVGKTASMFNTFVINQWGWLRRDMLGIGAGGMNRERLVKTVQYIAAVTAANSLFEDVLHMRSPFPAPLSAFSKEMEKSDDKTKAAFAAVREMGEMVPIIGGAARYGSSPMGPLVQYSEELLKIVGGDIRPSTVMKAAGKGLGVPGTTQITKTMKYLDEQY